MAAVLKFSSPQTRQFWEIEILYEDAELLALDKPAGLLGTPDPADEQAPNLLDLLREGVAARKPWATERALSYVLNINRLDPELSGVLLFAKTKPAFTRISDFLGTEKPARTYVALVRGAPREDTFEVAGKIAPHPAHNGLMHIDARRGKRSRTTF